MKGVRRGVPPHNEITQNLALIELMLQTARLREIPPLHPKIDKVQQNLVDFTYYLFTFHYSLKITFVDFEVISNSEKGRSMVQTRFGEFDLQGEFLWKVRCL